MTEKPWTPKLTKEKVVTIMFEKFNVQNLFIAPEPVMTMYSAGRTTGFVIDSGHEFTTTTPVIEGFGVPHSVERIEIAGKAISSFIQHKMKENGSVIDFKTA